jgi:3-hydroxybutyryl-CoA dehydrogenase
MQENAGTVGVVGGGTMGTGIAYVFALAGFQTAVVEPGDARAEQMFVEIESAAAGAVTRAKIDAVQATALRSRIIRVRTVAELAFGLDLVVETVPEQRALKLAVLSELETKRPTLLASNTSSISIDDLASSLSEPQQFIGMHFFNPVWSLGLVELIRGAHTSESSLGLAQEFVTSIGKRSIVVADIPGFATSRLDLIASLEAMRMLEDGVASADDIDRAVELAYRHPVGPLRLSDIVGLDVRLDIARQLEQTYGERYRPPQILIDKVAAGHLGRKSGQGFHTW